MRETLIRLSALCMAAAIVEQLTEDHRLRDGIRLLFALLAAGLIWQTAAALPEALFFR